MNTRAAVYVGAGLVGFATAATSTVSLYRLAEQCSFDWWLAPSLPIAFDAGAVVGALAWITEKGAARSWGRGIAVGSLAASLIGNGLERAIASGLVRPTLPLVLAVGGSIPVTLWAVVHLAALLSRAPARPARVNPQPRRGKTARPAPTTPAAPAGPAPTALAGRRYDHEQIAAWLAARPVEPYVKELEAIRDRWGCSATTAKRIRLAVRGAAVAS